MAASFAISHEIHTHLAEGRITADRLRLRQIIRNLLSNAIKHGNGQIAVVGRVIGNSYVLEVIDQGGGVAPDLERRLFRRYTHEGRTPLLTGTIGLGLAISHLLTTSMGARSNTEGLAISQSSKWNSPQASHGEPTPSETKPSLPTVDEPVEAMPLLSGRIK